jgi:predicted DNA-binding transcriptional regulator YafY
MPLNKNSFIRYKVIDECLTNSMHLYPSKEFIIERIEERLDKKISDSTFEKDIYAMRELPEPGYYAPIKYCPAHHGYYYEDENFSIAALRMRSEDLSSIEFAVSILSQFRDVPVLNRFSGVIDRIMSSVNIRKILNKNDFARIVQFEKINKIIGSEFIEPIVNAIHDKKVLSVRYRPFYKTDRELHILHPYLLKEYRNRWYVIGYQEGSKEVWTFGLDRIRKIEAMPGHPYLDQDFRAEEYFRHSVGIFTGQGKPTMVELRMDRDKADYLITNPMHPSQQIIRESKDYIYFSLTVYPTPDFISNVLSWAPNLVVVSPDKVKKQAIEALRKGLKSYS